ncbi:MAG: flagellar hook-associated protein FlgK [Planctomycetota bacterium]
MGSIGLSTGLQALLSAQSALDTVGNNIANANTPGYSRQRVNLTQGLTIARRNLLIGSGVVAKDLTRITDTLLNTRIASQLSVVGKFEAQFERASEIQAVFGDLQGVGVGQMLESFFDEISSLATDPADKVRRTSVVQSAEVLAARFNEVTTGLAEAQASTKGQAKAVVTQINDLATRIADLNSKIAELESGQVTANALRDERDLVVSQLSELVDVQAKDHGISGVRVHVGGALLVDGATTLPIELKEKDDGKLVVAPKGSSIPLNGISGKLGALLGHGPGFVDGLQKGLDDVAHQLILEVNREHTTGVPGNGPFKKLVGAVPLQLALPGGVLLAQTLEDSGLPFDVTEGGLTVNVHDLASGAIEKHKIEVGPEMKVAELVGALNDIPKLQAHIDDTGHFVISAEPGAAFDFSTRLVPNPDENGVFGGASASFGTSLGEPFALAAGQTLDLSTTTGGITTNYVYTVDPNDFANVGEATAEELAAALESDPAFGAAGLRAVVEDGHVFVQTTSEGPTESITLNGGTAAASLGLTGLVGQTVLGNDDAVGITFSGAYTGATDDTFTFVPNGDGVIGTTPGLSVDVIDGQGQVVASLDVGDGYVPGTPIVFGDGLSISFGLGELSATAGDRFSIDAEADSDTSDVLVALGLNTFFTGTDASDIAVRSEIAKDPGLLASSKTGSTGDNGTLLAILDAQSKAIAELDGQSIGERYSEIVADVGFEVSAVEASASSARAVLTSLQDRRDSVAGVNVDEELVQMIRFEQSYQAASRYIAALSDLENSLLQLI